MLTEISINRLKSSYYISLNDKDTELYGNTIDEVKLVVEHYLGLTYLPTHSTISCPLCQLERSVTRCLTL